MLYKDGKNSVLRHACGTWYSCHVGFLLSLGWEASLGRGLDDRHPRVRPSQTMCPEHNCSLVYKFCSAQWTFTLDSPNNSKWLLKHTGDHCHAAPEPAGSSHTALAKLSDLLNINPNLTAAKFASGIDGRSTFEPSGKMDPKLNHRGYLAKAKQKALHSSQEVRWTQCIHMPVGL